MWDDGPFTNNVLYAVHLDTILMVTRHPYNNNHNSWSLPKYTYTLTGAGIQLDPPSRTVILPQKGRSICGGHMTPGARSRV